MYCNNCGEEIEAGADFCPNCGTRITNKSGNKKILPKTNKENGDWKSRRMRIVTIAIIAGLIILNYFLLLYREIGLNVYNRRGGLTRSEMEKLDIKAKNFNFDEIEIGDYITFGRYEQDNDSTNGAEDIEWRVLDKETVNSNGKKCILVISKYALDCLPYNDKRKDITWQKCDLRGWLNDDFYNRAFSKDEKNQIVLVNNDNPDASFYSSSWEGKGGNDTSDNVFLLSFEQAENLFIDYDDRECIPTDYALWNGAYVNYEHPCRWWLRSPGGGQYTAMNVDRDGSLGNDFVSDDYTGVRPALWIYLD